MNLSWYRRLHYHYGYSVCHLHEFWCHDIVSKDHLYVAIESLGDSGSPLGSSQLAMKIIIGASSLLAQWKVIAYAYEYEEGAKDICYRSISML